MKIHKIALKSDTLFYNSTELPTNFAKVVGEIMMEESMNFLWGKII